MAAELDADVRRHRLGDEDEQGAAATLAALAEWDPALLRRALLGEAGDANHGGELLRAAVEIAKDERR